jgi:hypothetical protein
MLKSGDGHIEVHILFSVFLCLFENIHNKKLWFKKGSSEWWFSSNLWFYSVPPFLPIEFRVLSALERRSHPHFKSPKCTCPSEGCAPVGMTAYLDSLPSPPSHLSLNWPVIFHQTSSLSLLSQIYHCYYLLLTLLDRKLQCFLCLFSILQPQDQAANHTWNIPPEYRSRMNIDSESNRWEQVPPIPLSLCKQAWSHL